MTGQNEVAIAPQAAHTRALTHLVWRALSRHTSSLLLLLVFTVEVAVGAFVIRDLRTANVEAQSMYAGSVLGLRRIGELQYEAQETRRATLYALTTNDSNLQVEYADQTREADARVTTGIADYLRNARNPSETEVGTRLQLHWLAYLKIRDEVLASILEGSTKEAVSLDLTGGVPSFELVRQDLEEVKKLYEDQASQRLANVAATSHRSVVRLIAVLFFTLMFASASIWAIQHSRMQSTLQLAKMQMEFVASVSHELRTPLAVICSAADNIADGVTASKEQMLRYGSVLRSQSRQINELINQILLYASTREAQSPYVMQSLQVQEVIASVMENTTAVVQEARIVLECNVDPNLPAVDGDESALGQCLQNLVLNAVKFSGDGRWVRIGAVLAFADDFRPEVQISVEDRGIGIDSSEFRQIFEPFYRSPRVRAAQIHGTGLGLPLAKSIAEAMGGKLTVTSKLGVGSTFTLHLPVGPERRPQSAVAMPGPDAVIPR